MQSEGRRVLVTGANRGLGRTLRLLLLKLAPVKCLQADEKRKIAIT
jgi:NAD(P)-dependent dehydrogenase (short-subunit alcohol dehydrogenase family)